jgi:hypothetical protein
MPPTASRLRSARRRLWCRAPATRSPRRTRASPRASRRCSPIRARRRARASCGSGMPRGTSSSSPATAPAMRIRISRADTGSSTPTAMGASTPLASGGLRTPGRRRPRHLGDGPRPRHRLGRVRRLGRDATCRHRPRRPLRPLVADDQRLRLRRGAGAAERPSASQRRRVRDGAAGHDVPRLRRGAVDARGRWGRDRAGRALRGRPRPRPLHADRRPRR